MEGETNSGVPFLDTKVIRLENGEIILGWYQTPNSSGRFITIRNIIPLLP